MLSLTSVFKYSLSLILLIKNYSFILCGGIHKELYLCMIWVSAMIVLAVTMDTGHEDMSCALFHV